MTPKSNVHSRGRGAAYTGALILGLAGACALALWSPQTHTAMPGDLVQTPGSAAMRVSIDPVTGALVPGTPSIDKTADADLRRMLSRSSDGLVEVTHPDGHVSVDLEGRFMSASMARINADGELETICTESAETAEEFLAGAHQQPEVQ